MPLIGTAGHVDHGKSTLVKEVTGRDPDRWEEEKQRGLTIDLGFAWATLPDGTEVSFVDVPGHERFLKNMLAGIEAIDVALFVVAADEGWMPQSEEHLAVLDLLEVEQGVVALTKVDLVDDDLAALAKDDVEDRLDGTTLQGSRVIPVSSLTGEGMDDLLAELQQMAGTLTTVDLGYPRLWADRSFSAAGAGTIVTGSLLDGVLEVGQSVVVYPAGSEARIRGIQSHEQAVDAVMPGRRVALNLSGIDRDMVGRGDMIGLPSQWDTSRRFLARTRLARYHDELARRGAYQIHLGTATVAARVTGLDGDNVIFTLDRDLPMAVGDRFVIRDTGRRLVVAGGRVLDPAPGPARRALASAAVIDPEAGLDETATALLEMRGQDSSWRLGAHTRGGKARDAVSAGETAISPGLLESLRGRAVDIVGVEHHSHPLRVGMPMATLAKRLGVDLAVAIRVVGAEPRLERIGPDVREVGFEVVLGLEAQAEWDRAKTALERGLDVPAISNLGLDPELVHLKIREGSLVRVSEDLAYLPEQMGRIREIIASLPPEFTVAEFRDAAGLSRKYAVPLLEWADEEGLTIRRGDIRRLR